MPERIGGTDETENDAAPFWVRPRLFEPSGGQHEHFPGRISLAEVLPAFPDAPLLRGGQERLQIRASEFLKHAANTEICVVTCDHFGMSAHDLLQKGCREAISAVLTGDGGLLVAKRHIRERLDLNNSLIRHSHCHCPCHLDSQS